MNAAFFRTYQGPSQKQLNAALNEFAELVALDMPLNAIATAMEITGGSACVYLRMLCQMMGEPVQ